MSDLKKALGKRFDAWMNTITGVGTSRDKTASMTFTDNLSTNLDFWEILYDSDYLSRRIVDTLPKEMLREGFEVKHPERDNMHAEVMRLLGERDALSEVLEGMKWGRLYGGALTVLGTANADMSEPLRDSDRVDYLMTIDRRYIEVDRKVENPTSTQFGKPEVYRVTSTSRTREETPRVHYTRTLRWEGHSAPRNRRETKYNGWGAPVLLSVWEVLQRWNEAFGSTAIMLSESSIGIFKMQGLINMIAEDEEQSFMKRMATVDLAKSAARSLLLDAELEDYSRDQLMFGGVAETLDRFMLTVASAAEMPATLLWERSPAGLNATGDSDVRQFYDRTAAEQRDKLAPRLRYLIDAVCREVGLPLDYKLEFKPLWQQSDKERAETDKLHAEADNLRISMGVILPEEAAMSLPDNHRTQIDRDLRSEALADPLSSASGAAATAPEALDTPAPEANEEDATNKVGALQLAPTDIAKIVKVNEARAANNLGPLTDSDGNPDPDGNLTIAEFDLKKKAAAEREAASNQPPPTAPPNAPPKVEEEEEDDAKDPEQGSATSSDPE